MYASVADTTQFYSASTQLAAPISMRATASAQRMVRARYDAAALIEANRRHWANSDSLSPNAANNPEVRRRLRNRARYEAANNSYCKGMLWMLACDMVGTGPRVQFKTGDPEADELLEKRFHRWARAINLPRKLLVARMAYDRDGETFIRKTYNPKLRTSVKLDLRVIEAECITTPTVRLLKPDQVDGIEFDEHGNPEWYHLLKHHPGEAGTVWRAGMEYSRVNADHMIHWCRDDRPGCFRGVPAITPALPLFACLRRYTQAVLGAAEIAASHAGVLYTDALGDEAAAEAEEFETIEIEHNAMTVVPAGWKLAQMKAEQPTTTYPQFKREVIAEIGRCLIQPANIATGDSSQHNYSSARFDDQGYRRYIVVDRSQCNHVVMDSIVYSWLDEAALIPGLIPEGLGPYGEWDINYFWPGREFLDPQKEANAVDTRLKNGTTTLAAEYAKEGLDWEDQILQRAEEIKLQRDVNVETFYSTTAAGGSTDADPGEKEEAEDAQEAEV